VLTEREKIVIDSFIQDGSYESFHILFDLYYRSLCFYALTFVKNDQEAEDLVQDTFRLLWEKKASLDEPQKLIVYLYKTVKNNALNLLRKRGVEKKYSEWSLAQESEFVDEQHAIIQAEVYREIMTQIKTLPEKCQEVFVLSYVHEKTEEEVAATLGVTVNTIKTQKMRAKRLLRGKLKYLKSLIILLHV
jgi:RNA polymerase sigma-70 factor (ECF subfamily)